MSPKCPVDKMAKYVHVPLIFPNQDISRASIKSGESIAHKIPHIAHKKFQAKTDKSGKNLNFDLNLDKNGLS